MLEIIRVEFLLILSIAGAVLIFLYLAVWKDQWIRNRPFPDSWQQILNRKLPFYGALSEDEQLRLQQLIQLFIAKKRFVGCAGLEVTEQI